MASKSNATPLPHLLQDAPEQAPHKLLAIPGPIELTDEVMHALAQPPVSHVSPQLARVFQESLKMTREVVCSTTAQPFIVGGSGTLGWDQVAANLIEPGDAVLVLYTGYFGDGFKDCLTTYNAEVDLLKPRALGSTVHLDDIEAALSNPGKRYKAVTITHVDTSTGVLSDIEAVAACVQRVSPETLVVVDGVCSVASEEIRMDAWGIDVVLTGSQKGLGAPPGLSILVASQKAMKVFEARVAPVSSYYASWKKWLPIMRSFEAGQAAYFGTPPVNLLYAYHTSLLQIVKRYGGGPTLDERFRLHRQASRRIQMLADQLGMQQLAGSPKERAHGMTAMYVPEGVKASDVLRKMQEKGVVIAGGLLPEIKDRYIRIGHMGTTVVDDVHRGDLEVVTQALREAIVECHVEREKASASLEKQGA